MEWNDIRDEVGINTGVYDNPVDLTAKSWTVMRFAEVEEGGRLQWLIRKDGCMHCADPGCLKACPAPGAIVQYANGVVDFHQENCIGCGYCVTGCPFNVPRISKDDGKAYKCSLCSDRVAVGQAPACAKACPTGAIQYGSKSDMKDYAAKRIADLNERGFAKAGLYDPAGVGGTHVMYVLHHAYRPLYPLEASLEAKVEAIATRVYGAEGVEWSEEAKRALKAAKKEGCEALPVVVAKAATSLSDNPRLRGRPRGFTVRVTDLRCRLGAGFVVVYMGGIETLPGLPKTPQAFGIDVDEEGNIRGMDY